MAREEEFYPDSSRSLDSLRHVRLMALLRDMVESEGRVKAAATLGVSFRTVVRAEESGRLTAHMSHALERHLLLGGGSAAAQQRERVETLTKRVAALEEELRSRLEAIEAGSAAASEEQTKAMCRFDRRLARLEAGRDSQAGPEPGSAKRSYVPGSQYPGLVTLEAEPGEEHVYGEATAVIVEWRKARAVFLESLKTGSALSRAVAYERVLELEIGLIDVHELTLPPRSYPWDTSERLEQVERRRETLEQTRSDRAGAERRRRLRRVLTFGLWRD